MRESFSRSLFPTSVAEKRAGTARGGDGSYSITKRPEGLDHRSRDKSGQIHEKRGDTIVSTLRKHYGEDFARGVERQNEAGDSAQEGKGIFTE